MKVISILSQKGGSGKTTLAIHLAAEANDKGKIAVIADLDPQASAYRWSEARQAAGHSPDPAVFPTHPAQLQTFLNTCKGQGVDYVFIDTAPQSDSIGRQAAELADLALITCKPSIMDLRAIQDSLHLAQIAKIKPYVILSQIEPHGTRHDEARQLLKELNVSVLPVGTGKRVSYMDALVDGRTVMEYEPDGKAAAEVRGIFSHILTLFKQGKREKVA